MTPFVLCDVFGERPFAGNPLAVFLDSTVDDDTMASLAVEFGWSEITFVSPISDTARVRIWTPYGELPFAGHPTIGTAVVLGAENRLPAGPATLELGIGPVDVVIDRAGPSGGRSTMVQRAPQFGAVAEDHVQLAAALGLMEDDLAPDLPAQVVSTGLGHFMVPLRTLDALGRVRVDQHLFGPIKGLLGVDSAYTFTVDTPGSAAAARARLMGWGKEDAATGSAAGPLGAYLVRYGLHRAGILEIEQGIEMGRPSRIAVEVPLEAGEIGPVRVSGEVHIWGRGRLGSMPSGTNP